MGGVACLEAGECGEEWLQARGRQRLGEGKVHLQQLRPPISSRQAFDSNGSEFSEYLFILVILRAGRDKRVVHFVHSGDTKPFKSNTWRNEIGT